MERLADREQGSVSEVREYRATMPPRTRGGYAEFGAKHPRSDRGDHREHDTVCRSCSTRTWNICGSCNHHCHCHPEG